LKKKHTDKIKGFIPKTFFSSLSAPEQDFIQKTAKELQFTFQEFRQLTEYARDLQMWGETTLADLWPVIPPGQTSNKKAILPQIHARMQEIKSQAKSYAGGELIRPKKREKGKIVLEHTEKNIFGMCPVASEKTVCCNLKTIDAVENCIFGCSYCTIQTFYKDSTVFDDNLAEKLSAIKLDPQRRYHIGTGQSSDSLAWGNKNGTLDSLFNFARKNPNVMLEFKTKSNNIRYFLEHDVPPNVVCSWSLNPQEIIDNEEHFTAGLEDRIHAARQVADIGVKVAFHFHPIIYYENWRNAYPEIADRLLRLFSAEEILFISFGSVTFIKPVLKKIRGLGFPTKITQMELVTDPHGKMTYPDAIKVEKFSAMYKAFANWHDRVFFYLCMEKATLWEQSLGYVYATNDEFEQAMLNQCFSKIYPLPISV